LALRLTFFLVAGRSGEDGSITEVAEQVSEERCTSCPHLDRFGLAREIGGETSD
jgi:hypothetical protein